MLVIGLLIIVSSASALTLTDNLISYYTFDTDASDDHGTNDGSVVGSFTHNTTVKRFGAGSYRNDGSNGYINASNSTDFEFDFDENFTFSAWFYLDDFDAAQALITRRDGTNEGILLRIATDGYADLFFVDRTIDVYQCLNINYIGSSQFPQDEWVHIAFVYNTSSYIKVYANGVDLGASCAGTANNPFYDNPIPLKYGGYTTYFLDGNIDEAAVWSRPLNVTEIGWLQTRTYSNLTGGAPGGGINTTLTLNAPTNYTHDTDGNITVNVTPTSGDATVNLTILVNGAIVHNNASAVSNQSYIYYYTNSNPGGYMLDVWANSTANNVTEKAYFSFTTTTFNIALTWVANFTEGIDDQARNTIFTPDSQELFIANKNGQNAGTNELVIYDRDDWTNYSYYQDMATTVNPQEIIFHPVYTDIAVIGVSRDDDSKSLHVYNISDWTEITRIGTNSVLHALQFNSNGSRLIYENSNDVDARIYVINSNDPNPANWEHIKNFSYDYGADVFDIAACGDYMAFDNTARTMWVWNISSENPDDWTNISTTTTWADRSPTDFTPDCNYLLAFSVSGTKVYIYKMPEMTVYKELDVPGETAFSRPEFYEYNINSNAYGIYGGWMGLVNENGVRLVNLADYSFKYYNYSLPVQLYPDFSPDGSLMAVPLSTDDKVMIFNVTGYEVRYNLRINAHDYYDNTSIDNFTLTLANSTSFTTTNGTVYLNNVTGNLTFDLTSINGDTGVYFNLTDQWVYASNTTERYYYPYQGLVSFDAYKAITGASISGVTFYVNGTAATSPLKIKAGLNYLVWAEKAGFFNKSSYFNVTALDNKTISLTGLYDTIVNITAVSAWTGTNINTFNITATQSTYGFSTSASTTNGTIRLSGLVKGLNYLFTITPNTSLFNPSSATINPNAQLYNYSFTLYPYNSFNFSFAYYNDTLIKHQINVTIIGSDDANNYTTTTGYLNLSALEADFYELRTEATNFSDRKYFFTVTNYSTQTHTIYLALNASTELQVFRILDTTNQEVTGAVLRVQKETVYGSNLYSNYAEELTNAEGKTNVYLEKGINNYYRFSVVVNGSVKKIYPSLQYYTSKTNFISGVSETVEIVILLEDTTTTDYYNDVYGLVTSMGFYGGGNKVYYSWIDGQNAIEGAAIIIEGKFLDNSTSYEIISVNTSGSTTGNLTYTFTPVNNTIYNILGYINYSGYDLLTDTRVKSYTVTKNVDKNTGLLFAVAILVVTALITIYLGVLLSAVLTFLMIIFTNLVGFTNLPTTVITSLLALAIILLIRVSKGEDE